MKTLTNKEQGNQNHSTPARNEQKQTSAFQFKDNRPEAIQMKKLQTSIQNSQKNTFQFIDNRPETIAQQRLQEIANNSPQSKQAAQLQRTADNYSTRQQQPLQKKENNTGLPDNLKAGIENLSGMSLDDVKVHRNSDKPAQLQAHAFAQGTNIHLGAGQEKHLPHEAWHVVQQKQGRVKPTLQLKEGVNINDDIGLEKEADLMGAKAMQMKVVDRDAIKTQNIAKSLIQRAIRSRKVGDSDEIELASLAAIAAEYNINVRTLYRPIQKKLFTNPLFSVDYKNAFTANSHGIQEEMIAIINGLDALILASNSRSTINATSGDAKAVGKQIVAILGGAINAQYLNGFPNYNIIHNLGDAGKVTSYTNMIATLHHQSQCLSGANSFRPIRCSLPKNK